MSRRSPVTGTVIASDGSPARSGRSRSPCRGRASAVPDGGTAEWKSRRAAALRPDDPASGGADRRHLPRRHQHPPGAPGAGGAVQGGDRQGRGQPHLAEGEDRLGSLVEAPARRGRHRPADPRRHRRARPARQEGDVDLAAGRPRRPPRRPEGAAGGEEHGRRERGRLAGAARRPGRPRAEDARVPDHRRRRRPGEGAGGAVAGGADPALHGSQAPEPAGPRPRTSCTRRSRPTTPT